MCWQALTSNPLKSCERGFSPSVRAESPNAIAYNAIIGAFSMTWTSWRTSSAASEMFSKDAADATASATRRKSTRLPQATGRVDFSPAVVGNLSDIDINGVSKPATQDLSKGISSEMQPEPWQFYLMMFLGGAYMAMVLTDWDSSSSSSNGVSMWVKIVAQWLTMLLFLWTLLAPKLFPNREFN
jgi:serine incorporator 1/3